MLSAILKKFDEQFIKVKSNTTRSGFALMCDPEFAKEFIQEEVKSLLEGLKAGKWPEAMAIGDRASWVEGWNNRNQEINTAIQTLLGGEVK